jgi:hypothetical protein
MMAKATSPFSIRRTVSDRGQATYSVGGTPRYNCVRMDQPSYRPIRAGETMLRIVGEKWNPNPELETVPAR